MDVNSMSNLGLLVVQVMVELFDAASIAMMPGVAAVVVEFKIVPSWPVCCGEKTLLDAVPFIWIMSPLLETEVNVCNSFSLRTRTRETKSDETSHHDCKCKYIFISSKGIEIIDMVSCYFSAVHLAFCRLQYGRYRLEKEMVSRR